MDFGAENGHQPHEHNAEEWAELMARTVAHLAAQLTMTQVRLRALGTELSEGGGVDRAAVQSRVRAIAAAETGVYLRENLGEALVDVIDVESLEADIVAFLNAE
ncbi:MAG: hypothetical protein ACRDJH_17040 [Thermomicrobiales bacterium]